MYVLSFRMIWWLGVVGIRMAVYMHICISCIGCMLNTNFAPHLSSSLRLLKLKLHQTTDLLIFDSQATKDVLDVYQEDTFMSKISWIYKPRIIYHVTVTLVSTSTKKGSRCCWCLGLPLKNGENIKQRLKRVHLQQPISLKKLKPTNSNKPLSVVNHLRFSPLDTQLTRQSGLRSDSDLRRGFKWHSTSCYGCNWSPRPMTSSTDLYSLKTRPMSRLLIKRA